MKMSWGPVKNNLSVAKDATRVKFASKFAVDLINMIEQNR